MYVYRLFFKDMQPSRSGRCADTSGPQQEPRGRAADAAAARADHAAPAARKWRAD